MRNRVFRFIKEEGPKSCFHMFFPDISETVSERRSGVWTLFKGLQREMFRNNPGFFRVPNWIGFSPKWVSHLFLAILGVIKGFSKNTPFHQILCQDNINFFLIIILLSYLRYLRNFATVMQIINIILCI